jgi:hypothetical protein
MKLVFFLIVLFKKGDLFLNIKHIALYKAAVFALASEKTLVHSNPPLSLA